MIQLYIKGNNTYLLMIAESSTQGILVAPSTSIPSLSTPTPLRKNIKYIKLKVCQVIHLCYKRNEVKNMSKILAMKIYE